MRRHISCSLPLAALSALAMGPLAHAEVASGLRGQRSAPVLQMEARPLHVGPSHRRLGNDDQNNDDQNNDDQNDDIGQQWADYNNNNYDGDDAEGNDGDDDNDYVVSSGSLYYDYDADADGGWADDTEVSGFKSYVQHKASDAGTKVWEFYESPPSEWTADQWDLVFGLAFSAFALCCMGSACCAYYCMFRDDDPSLAPKAAWTPKRPKTEDKASQKRRFRFRGKNHRDRFTEDQYRRYQEEDEEDAATLGTTGTAFTGFTDDETKVTAFTGFTERDDDTKVTEATGYQPPVATSSLADYTSVQREKEAMIMEEWKRAHSPKSKKGGSEDDDEGEDGDDEDGSLDIDPNPSLTSLPPGEEDDWDDGAETGTNATTKSRRKSKRELDLVLGRSDEGPKEDKLLEAREHQHNLVGYYL